MLTRAQAPAVPIVVLTGFQDDLLGDEALKQGAQDYLVKGHVDGNLLARSMRYAIDRKSFSDVLVGQAVALAKAGVLRGSRQRLIASHEGVRQGIAAQLHDSVQEELHDLKGRIQEFVSGIVKPSEQTRLLGEAIDALNDKIDHEVGVLGQQLYPPGLSEGLLPAFQSLRDQFGKALDINIELGDPPVEDGKAEANSPPGRVALAAYRIAEESLTNAIKHAKASKVTMRLDTPREGWLRLTVRDDGQGFDVGRPSDGLGLGTMHDYAEAVDGECSVHSDPGEGTVVSAVLPIAGHVAPSTTGAK